MTINFDDETVKYSDIKDVLKESVTFDLNIDDDSQVSYQFASMVNYFSILEPIFDVVVRKGICEIGGYQGSNLIKLNNYCQSRGVNIHSVDPAIDISAEVDSVLSQVKFFDTTSLEYLSTSSVDDVDTVIIDGDHNYETVFQELECINKKENIRLVILHDTSWPCGRIDTFYNPQSMDTVKEVKLGNLSLSKEGSGLDLPFHWNVNYDVEASENDGITSNSGVMTAVEKFIESTQGWEKTSISSIYGLTLLYREEVKNTRELVENLQHFNYFSKFLDVLELNRRMLISKVHRQGSLWETQQKDIDRLNNDIDRLNNEKENLANEVNRLNILCSMDLAIKNKYSEFNSNQIGTPTLRKVAIITRTKDRAIMLPRVLSSLEQQTYKDFIWVLVNDNGIKEPVNQIAELAKSKGIEVKVIHREESVGMEAASNDGIRNSESEYVLIHDDDDSLKPTFLEESVAFLEEQTTLCGVVTHSTKVVEEITDRGIKILSEEPYNPWLKNIHIADLAHSNLFPPISFLFRRSIYQQVDGFNESLPVLGDWDFHLRCIELADIGVIQSELANYHHRYTTVQDAYSNSIIGGVDKHIYYESVFRNNLLRRDLKENKVGIGFLVNSARVLDSSPRFYRYDLVFDVILAVARKLRLNKIIKILKRRK